jgi:hypothetical protein
MPCKWFIILADYGNKNSWINLVDYKFNRFPGQIQSI